MITSDQKNEGCIALNKLKLLISEAAYVYDLKSLYTAIETSINKAATETCNAAGVAATLKPCTNISVTWLQSKLTELKKEIKSTLTEVSNQIKNNI